MIICKTCGYEFSPKITAHYIARDNGKVGLGVAFGSNNEEKIYDAFDCPICGCQIITQERKRRFIMQIEELKNMTTITFDGNKLEDLLKENS